MGVRERERDEGCPLGFWLDYMEDHRMGHWKERQKQGKIIKHGLDMLTNDCFYKS